MDKPPPLHTTLLSGDVRPLGPKGIASGIAKRPNTAPARLTRLGFAGDAQGDTRNHGGIDKAAHHYPFDHYAGWQADLGGHALLDRPGAFGENISTRGLVESDVAIGDRFRLGRALVEISQGRQPCFRLNLRFGIADMARRMQGNGRTGWYYRVIEEGDVAPSDRLTLVDRLTPEWTIDRLWRLLYVDVMDLEGLREMAALPHLPDRWRQTAARRVETRAVEDWRRRLEGD
ncbi:MOSC domain-containing protein YiiM [Sphingomonas laterariae]|uniref:MOSC domain-containing protein YiiM n=1 Tax=Edaphosphingomonas laterariae TaxID=861865 RepID=A0A239DRK0_9SPHN|nr:MOSC domain-containing protein [Sphingomonas laterariae]SNS35255.1 MOSC domain-containing protein YiiM [Sphingomonas laterariae]